MTTINCQDKCCGLVNVSVNQINEHRAIYIPHVNISLAGIIFKKVPIDTRCPFPIIIDGETFLNSFGNISPPLVEKGKELMGMAYKQIPLGISPPYYMRGMPNLSTIKLYEKVFIRASKQTYQSGFTYSDFFGYYEDINEEDEIIGMASVLPHVPLEFLDDDENSIKEKRTVISVYCIIQYKRDASGNLIIDNALLTTEDFSSKVLGLSAFKDFGLSLWPKYNIGYICTPENMKIECHYTNDQ